MKHLKKPFSARPLFGSMAFLLFFTGICYWIQMDKTPKHPMTERLDLGPASSPPPQEYFKRMYQDPKTGDIPARASRVHQYWKRHFQQQAQEKGLTEELIDWREVGPTNVGGRTRAIAIDAQDSRRVIAGGVRGGLFITSDQGNSWEHVEGITGNESVTFVTQHPNQLNKWYASTGEFVGSGANFFGGGLLYSTDNGHSWDIQQYEYQFIENKNDYGYAAVSDMPLSSAHQLGREGAPFQFSSRVLVSPASNSIFVATNGWGILKSDNDLQSFSHSLPPPLSRVERQELPIDDATTFLLRFENSLSSEQDENPLSASEAEYKEGIFGQGVFWDSTNLIEYHAADHIDYRAGTIEFWMKPNWDGDDGQENVILAFGDFPEIIFIHRVFDQLEILYATGAGREWYGAGFSVRDWRAGEWHHLAFTWNSTEVAAFSDGAKLATRPVSFLPEILNSSFQFGNSSGAGMNAVIDELRISNRARTAEEISQSYQFGVMNEAFVNFPSFRPEFSDVSINSEGDLLAFLSGGRGQGSGIYHSTDDGAQWINITPTDWPDETQRGLVCFAPSNPDIAYLLVLTNHNQNGGEPIIFYQFDLGAGTVENRTANMPKWTGMPFEEDNGAGIIPGTYYLLLSVKPDDENFVVIGGALLARSDDGFATLADTGYIHYILGSAHVDQHIATFDPKNPDNTWLGNDGGLYFTQDITRNGQELYDNRNFLNVLWENKNNGYNVTQFYTVAQSEDPLDHRVTGGAQDNGYLTVKPFDLNQPGRAFGYNFGSDGSSVYMTPEFTYMSFQFGETYKLRKGTDGEASFEVEWTQISPWSYDRLFIHPWTVDPNDVNTMFYPIQNRLYRIDNIDQVPPYTSYGQENYNLISDGEAAGYETISALSVSTTPAHTLYFAAVGEKPMIKRVKNAQTESPLVEDVSIHDSAAAPWTWTKCIAPNPADGDEWLVVISNYNVPSLYQTVDGGQTYRVAEGNLAGNVDIPGPTMEWADILVYEGKTYYLLGTHIGVFMTQELDGEHTIWEHQGTETVGYALVTMIRSRSSDGKIVVATHGRGFFAGYLSDPVFTGVEQKAYAELKLESYPNPAMESVSLSFELDRGMPLTLEVFDLSGKKRYREVVSHLPIGSHTLTIPLHQLAAGTYVVQVIGNNYRGISKVLKINR